jgi:hypothetical protein
MISGEIYDLEKIEGCDAFRDISQNTLPVRNSNARELCEVAN